jgi:hypothetical protein
MIRTLSHAAAERHERAVQICGDRCALTQNMSRLLDGDGAGSEPGDRQRGCVERQRRTVRSHDDAERNVR